MSSTYFGKGNAFFNAVGMVLAFFALMITSAIYGGFVFSKLWLWLILPIFPSLPVLTIPFAIGLAFVIRVAIHDTESKSDKTFWEAVLYILILQTIVLGMGYVISLFY